MANIQSSVSGLKSLALAAILVAFAAPSFAMSYTPGSSGLGEALTTQDSMKIYEGKNNTGLNLSGGLFSGRASGVDPAVSNYVNDKVYGNFQGDTASLEGDQHVYAMLIDGSYKFDSDLGTGLPIHPYMSSGVGMAVYDAAAPSVTNLATQGGGMVPLFRVGGGVSYQVAEKLHLALDYTAGFSGSGDQGLATHSQTELQVVNMGMHYQF